MNILPKKRWHVRTKENIARVRKDEAEAAEKEKQEKLRIEHADRELRLNILKKKSKEDLKSLNILTEKLDESEVSKWEHINLFADIQHTVGTTNKEHDREVKEKKEDYEKKIGYLTYLGQDTNEALGKKNWYDVPPGFSKPAVIKDTYDKLVLKDEDGKPKKKDIDVKDGEIGWKSKQQHDPINAFRHLCYKNQKHRKEPPPYKSIDNRKKESHIMSLENNKKYKNKGKISDNEVKLQKLREARIKREQQEKCKTELFLKKLSGGQIIEQKDEKPKVVPKYNSQFNPELARQNYR